MAKPGTSDIAKREEAVLAFWKEKQIFEKTLSKPAPKGEFVFYDGPPFATGLPHAGSLLSSVSKDLIPRYKTMRGYRVRRRWGWDTHGLPIESLVEKKLGLKNKKEIFAVGVETFNETARSMVLEYVHEWKRYIERVGRFVDFDNSYKTMDNSFIESVWWGLKRIHDKGRLYEGRKVLMYCPHCETPLAKAEIAMDNTYKDVTEEAVTAKFRVKDPEAHGLPKNTYLLAWTTTPWTLPGNVGLAVHPDLSYRLYTMRDGTTYIAEANLFADVLLARNEMLKGLFVGEDRRDDVEEMGETLKGSELVGIAYEPLYEIAKVTAHTGKKWEVLPADFVTTGEGTGIVHTAVIYGEDDYQLGVKEGLPMVPLLLPNATYNQDAPAFLQGKYIKKAEAEIKQDLLDRELLFSKAAHTHSYPHCYRCGTSLIYNAVSSWFIDIQAVKERMLKENEGIAWVPGHLKEGRFRHIVENAPDWTISRNRFWASPLPIWKDTEGHVRVIGSLEELRAHTRKSGNRYFVMRHGGAENNALGVLDSTNEKKWKLTEEGRAQAERGARALMGQGITRIYASPFARTTETATIVAEMLGLTPESIIFDDRLVEFPFGEFHNGPHDAFLSWRATHAYTDAVPGGGSYQDAKQRFGDFLYELEREAQNEGVLIVTHGIGLETLTAIAAGLGPEESKQKAESMVPAFAEPVELDFVPLPHNRAYELDLHLPYIDDLQLVDDSGRSLVRIPEVVDCWVESGSMPFAEYHYPFENKEEFEKRSPGDFISEYIGQTRAWFYYLHAISLELFDHKAFRNVITTGNVLAEGGAKLSKSKNNYTDPYVLFDQYGADAFRYYLMASPVMQAEDLTFRDEDVKEAHARVVNMLRNVHSFYRLYADERDPQFSGTVSHPLDRWIRARLAEVVEGVTDAFERYDVPRGVRLLRDFIDDLSTWYVRRSRDRVKGSDEADKQCALGTLHYVLVTFARVIAPVMPFVAEEIYRDLRTDSDPESVHLTEWPASKRSFFGFLAPRTIDTSLIEGMKKVRALASEGLMLRQKVDMKVRQPLQALSIPGDLPKELAAILADEVNVKQIQMNAEAIELDTNLTPELIREGDIRAFSRALAEARKELGLEPKDRVHLRVSEAGKDTLANVDLPGVEALSFGEADTYIADLSIGKIGFSIARDAA